MTLHLATAFSKRSVNVVMGTHRIWRRDRLAGRGSKGRVGVGQGRIPAVIPKSPLCLLNSNVDNGYSKEEN